jgi:eukaryotic-like serine/threonine-protein kinase
MKVKGISCYDWHKSAPPPLLRAKIPEIPLAVEAVLMRALAKDWTYRFADIQAFATALEQASNFETEPTVYSVPPPRELDATVAVQFPSQQPVCAQSCHWRNPLESFCW